MPQRLLRMTNKNWIKSVLFLFIGPPLFVWMMILYDEYWAVPTYYDRDFMEGLYQTCLDRGHEPKSCRREAMRMADLKNFRSQLPTSPR